jgi:hypothetical protein
VHKLFCVTSDSEWLSCSQLAPHAIRGHSCPDPPHTNPFARSCEQCVRGAGAIVGRDSADGNHVSFQGRTCIRHHV